MGVDLFLKYLKATLKAMTEFRLNFVFSNISMLVTNIFFMGSIVYLAYSFDGIGILSTQHIIFALTVVNLSHVIGVNFFTGITKMQEIIINGDLDRLLIKPIPIYQHVLIFRMNPYGIAEIITAFIFLAFNPISLFPTIFLFSISGAVLMNLNVYTLNLLPMFIDLNRSNKMFELYITFMTYPPDIFNIFIQKIALFIIPGAMLGYGAAYALSSTNWLIIYFSYLVFSIFIFLYLSKLGLKKYRSAGY